MAASEGLRRQAQVTSGGAIGGGKRPPGGRGQPWKKVPTDKPVVPLPTIKQVRVYSLSLVSLRSLSDRLTDMQEEDVEVQTSQDTSTQKSKTIGGQQ
jgi:hypothetical protein